MKPVFPTAEDARDPAWWAPLHAVERAIAGSRRYRFFDCADFMLMHRELRGPRPRLTLYKHIFTRRYLNLDDAGHAYRYCPYREGARGYGQYRIHKDLPTALDHLGLWELPWMKASLEEERLGLSCSDRWILHPDWDGYEATVL